MNGAKLSRHNMRYVAFDYETLKIVPGLQAPPPVCVSIRDADGARLELGVGCIPELLRRDDIIFIGASTSFDLAVASAWGDPETINHAHRACREGRVRDVILRQKAIDIAMGECGGYFQGDGDRVNYDYNLGFIAKRLLGIELKKEGDTRTTYDKLEGLPLEQWPKEYIDYALADGNATWDCFWAQEEGVAEQDAMQVLEAEPSRCWADFALRLESIRGMHTDPEGIEILQEGCHATLNELWPTLSEAGLVYEVRGIRKPVKDEGKRKKSDNAARLRMFQVMGGEGIWHTKIEGKRKKKEVKTFIPTGGWEGIKLSKTGKEKRAENEDWQQLKYVSIDAEACIDSQDPVLFQYSRWSKASNLLTGHVKKMWEGVEFPLHTNFDCWKETGRTGSSGPNTQNVRSAEGARECFKPRPGWAFIGCDYDKAELHSLSQICFDLFGESHLGDMLNAGFDPHLGLGARMLGIPYEEAKARLDLDEPLIIEYRKRGKPANFGYPGGMGPTGMMAYAKSNYNMIFTFEEACELYEEWQQAWPIVQRYLAHVRDETRYGSCTVVHHRSNRWRGNCKYTVAANTRFQGLAADAALAAVCEISERCYCVKDSALYGSRLVNFIHDENILETPIDRVTPAAVELAEVMKSKFNEWTPNFPVNATPVAMDRWTKKAKPVWLNGELQIYHYERKAA